MGSADQPDALRAHLGDAAFKLTTPEPAIDGLSVHTEVLGKLLKRHLIIVPPREISGPYGALVPEAFSYQQLLDDQRVKNIFLRRGPAFRVQVGRNLPSACPLRPELDNPRE